MLDIKFLRQNVDLVRRKMLERGHEILVGAFTDLDTKRRDILQAVESLRNERNDASKQIGERKKLKEDTSSIIAEMGDVSNRIRELEETLKRIEEDLDAMMLTIPNIPHESVACGKSADDNPVIREWRQKPDFDFVH